MEAKLTGPALAAWLIIGATICVAWSAPWYAGALGGFVAAMLFYVLWRALLPKLESTPWAASFFLSALFAALAAGWFNTPSDVQIGVFIGDARFAMSQHVAFAVAFALIALTHFIDGVTAWRRTREPAPASEAD
ncbi:MAG TPA: hypothetical protein PLS69_00820 [Terricaulis sp.]|nr:hypothetical protein [Terricaulis sp.]HRP10255.1 hypothetical protein [Terricaulis sp.]